MLFDVVGSSSTKSTRIGSALQKINHVFPMFGRKWLNPGYLRNFCIYNLWLSSDLYSRDFQTVPTL